MANNISKCFWTCMIVAMTNCLLLGGLIQQQTFNRWFFISRETISIAWKMPIHWGVHSSHQRWLDNLFWNCQAEVFTCYYVSDFKIWASIPKSRIAECHMHHISLVLVEPCCWRHIPRSLNLIKGSFLFWKNHWFKFWLVEDPKSPWWRHTWFWNIFFQDYFAKQPCNCSGAANIMNQVIRLWFKLTSSTLF